MSKPWLEIGVGSGRFAEGLGITTGIDPSAEMAKIASARITNTLVGRGENLCFRTASYRTAFIIVTLCFVQSPTEVLQEINRVLTRQGKLVIGMVPKESPWGLLYQEKKEQGHPFYRHTTFYNRDNVIAMLNESGFSVELETSTLFQKPTNVHSLESPRNGFYSEAGFVIIVARKRFQGRKII
ncbi:MAG: class I SAM-dependent methyltransferase [Dehalococcoidales bacterium]